MKSLLLVPALASLALLASVKDCKDRVCPRGMTLDPQAATCVCRPGLVPAPDGVGCVMPTPPPPTPEPSPTAEPSPSPSPSAEPSPTPEPSTSPGPSPSSDPAPATCPPLVCISAKVHLAAGPGGELSGPTACDSCRVVLDSTPHFGRCLPVWQCNKDHHNPCTVDGQAHIHSAPPPAVCKTWRACEDPRGYTWSKIGGPNVEWKVQEPGPTRGYQVLINTPVAGAYAWEVCAAGPIDGEGLPVRVAGPECRRVEFEVR